MLIWDLGHNQYAAPCLLGYLWGLCYQWCHVFVGSILIAVPCFYGVYVTIGAMFLLYLCYQQFHASMGAMLPCIIVQISSMFPKD